MRSRISTIRKGYLIPGSEAGLKYSNNAYIKIESIDNINWFSGKNENGSDHYIIFNNIIKWIYNSEKELQNEFSRIINLIIPEDDNSRGVFE